MTPDEPGRNTIDAVASAATTKAGRAALADIESRLVPPAVLGFRCNGFPDRFAPVTVSVYRDVDHDERGVRCGDGSVSAYDGSVHWYIKPPEDVLRG